VVVLRLEELCVFVANDLVQRFNLALTRIVLLSEHGVGGGDVLFILFQPPDLPEQPRSLQLFLLQRRLTPRQSVGVLHILGFHRRRHRNEHRTFQFGQTEPVLVPLTDGSVQFRLFGQQLVPQLLEPLTDVVSFPGNRRFHRHSSHRLLCFFKLNL